MIEDGTLGHRSATVPFPSVMPAEPPPFDLTRAREAFENAAALHGEATRRAAPRVDAGHLQRLRDADAAYVAALSEGRVRDAIEADDAFHGVLLEVAGDPDLRVAVDLLVPRIRRMGLYVFTRKAFDDHVNTHPDIVSSLEGGDGERAAALVEAGFREAGEDLMEVVRRSVS